MQDMTDRKDLRNPTLYLVPQSCFFVDYSINKCLQIQLT